MFRVSLTVKLAASYLLVAALIVGPTLVYLRAAFLSTLERLEAQTLEPRINALRDELDKIPDDDLDALDTAVQRFSKLLQLRVTLVDRDGTVLLDSEVPRDRIARVENHRDRPEIKEAMNGHFGSASRVSATVSEELVYAAVPLPATGPPRRIVRVARRVASMRQAATSALLTMRLSTGVGVTVALLLSFGAAVYVSAPLRKMRDAARAFSEGRWIEVPRFRTRDELEDLSIALDDLGRRLQQQLIAHGANESLLTQTIRALPRPALLIDADFSPLEVNGALREVGNLSPANEGEALTALLRTPSLEAARRAGTESGLPVELNLPLPGRPEEGHVPGLLVPLSRPVGAPLWLLFIVPERPLDEERGVPALVELLERVDRSIDAIIKSTPSVRREMAELRVRTDELVVAAGRPAQVGLDPESLGSIVDRAIEEVGALRPDRKIVFAPGDPTCREIRIAESSGLALRAVRALLRLAITTAAADRPVELLVDVQPTVVHFEVGGIAAANLGDPARLLAALAEAVGGSSGPRPKRSILRLTLPRA